MTRTLNFKISSALKDIIGQDLITDDNIAVFELVKNAYDAHAEVVDIIFENIYDKKNAKIIIKDNGKGMDFSDLQDKWLFVAYSAKKEGTEDIDYRDKIQSKLHYAGSKGIGRFSCDRLGKKLRLESTKEGGKRTEVLYTDWENFEENLRDEFVNIKVSHTWQNKSSYGLSKGTVLEISDLRNEWTRQSILKLKASLAKLINPNKKKGEHEFSIRIHSETDIELDEKETENYNKVNGEVENFIFETLGLKTTKIYAKISDDKKYITTELRDGGTLIYKIKEVNRYNLLDNIELTIFYLNMSAKMVFARRMGLPSKDYGHIFLYKHGFRVYPFGEPGEDPLKIDARKAQGYNRYLGTRELIGQIEIFSVSNEFKETSSRGDGLIKTKTYLQLEECFWDVLKRLERYVVEVQQWGFSVEDEFSGDINARITDFISKLSGSSEIVELNYSDSFIENIDLAQSESASNLMNNLKKIALETGNNKLFKEVELIKSKFKQLKTINVESLIENEKLTNKIEEFENKLEIKDKEIELLKESSKEEIIELMTIEHHINQATFRVDEYIRGLYEIAKENKDIENNMIDLIYNISLENKKIASLVKFVRSANIDLLSSRITEDLVKYIEQYVRNVYKNDRTRRINKQLVREVNVIVDKGTTFSYNFVPLEINIVIDNLLDNSFKASSTKVDIAISSYKKMLIIDYQDNGVGIDPLVKDTMFDFGVTTTSGSGIGLNHIKKIVESMNGNIYSKESKYGANFIIEISKQ